MQERMARTEDASVFLGPQRELLQGEQLRPVPLQQDRADLTVRRLFALGQTNRHEARLAADTLDRLLNIDGPCARRLKQS